jgi:hypothetical protein
LEDLLQNEIIVGIETVAGNGRRVVKYQLNND